MSRKSARLLFKSKMQSEAADCSGPAAKRQKIDVEQGTLCANRKQHFRIQNNQLPISSTVAVTTSMIVPSDEVDSLVCRESLPLAGPASSGDSGAENAPEIIHLIPKSTPLRHQFFRFSNHFRDEMSSFSPLPHLDWADTHDMWSHLHKKEERYYRDTEMFDNHPEILAYMRAILLGWLTEVCELYRLHRETFYLAVEFIDRYLTVSKNVRSCHLQLVGITALFIAAKIEEIYPPKTSEFAYVCDGAFDEDMIHSYELTMIKALDWMLSPITPNTWIQLYLQIAATHSQLAKREQLNLSLSSPMLFDLASVVLAADSASSPTTGEGQTTSPVGCLERNIQSCREECVDCGNSPSNHRDSETDTDTELDSGEQSREEKHAEQDSAEQSRRQEHKEHSAEQPGREEHRPSVEGEEREQLNFVYPLYSTHQYLQVCRLMDLVTVDRHSLRWKYSVLAAAAVFLAADISNITRITGLTWEELEPCVRWMTIHKEVLDKHQPKAAVLKTYASVPECNAHKIQNHSVNKALWEEVASRSTLFFQNNNHLTKPSVSNDPQQSSPCQVYNFVTPPRSVKKVSRETSMQQ